MRNLILIAAVLLSVVYTKAQCNPGDIGGNVFLELPANGANANTYGTKDANEPGIAGINVTITDANGTTTTVTTDANGDWSVTAPAFPVRVEWAWNQTWLRSSTQSAVQFVSASDCNVNFALHDPNDFSNTPQPPIVSNVRAAGDTTGNNYEALQTIQYTWTGLNSDYQTYNGNQGTAPPPVTDVTHRQVGAVWGKAYQKSRERMFASSVLWRHVGLAAGLGAIFVMDYSTSPTGFSGHFDLQGLVPANGGPAIDFGSVCRSAACAGDPGNTGIASDYTLANVGAPDIDLDAFAKTGKMGIGAICIDNNTETLWAVNLNQKAIISVDVSGDFASLPGTVNQYPIASIPGLPSCTGGEIRPWAIKIYRGKGYLGLVCDGITSQDTADMDAFIVSFDPANPAAGFTTEFSFPLSYSRSNSTDDNWQPWSDTYNPFGSGYWRYYPQPILSAIEFDELGNMYIAFIDRFGLQGGLNQHPPISGTSDTGERTSCIPDIFKICNNAGSFELEGTGSCPTNYGTEFFNDRSGDGSIESVNGALVILPGSNQLVAQVIDPHPNSNTGSEYWTSQGVSTYSTTTGSIDNWYTHIRSDEPYNGKGLGMGDVELLTGHAPIEIGNLVWNDANGNGIQDPNESGIAGVQVELLDQADNLLATATTDANGSFIFSSDPNGTSNAAHIYNLSALNPATNYILRISNAQGGTQQAPLAGLTPTAANTGQGPNPDYNDADASLNADDLEIAVSPADIPVYGANNHSFDFGFKPVQYDFGDLPDLAAGTAQGDYETLLANNGPRHIIDPNLHLGAGVTADTDGQQSANADGDTDDGIASMNNLNLVKGGTWNMPLNITNNTGNTAQIEIWIDWNADGDFNDAGEMVADTDDASIAGAIPITVPASAAENQNLGVRVRLSTQNNMTPYGQAPDGEVEDYFIKISCPSAVCLPMQAQKM